MSDGSRPALSQKQSELLGHGTKLIEKAARKVRASQRKGELGDLVAVGMEVCMTLVYAYEGGGKDAFLARLWVRSRGAMLDSLRLDRKHGSRAGAMQKAVAVHLEGVKLGDQMEEVALRRARLEDARDELLAGALLALVPPIQNPEEALLSKEDGEERERVLARLHDVLDEMDPIDRQLIQGYDLDGATLKETAERIGIEYSKAGYRYENARKTLGKRLAARAARR